MNDEFFNISPIDGRYKETTKEVRDHFSELYLIKNRVWVEIEWLKLLFNIKEFGIKVTSNEIEILDDKSKVTLAVPFPAHLALFSIWYPPGFSLLWSISTLFISSVYAPNKLNTLLLILKVFVLSNIGKLLDIKFIYKKYFWNSR